MGKGFYEIARDTDAKPEHPAILGLAPGILDAGAKSRQLVDLGFVIPRRLLLRAKEDCKRAQCNDEIAGPDRLLEPLNSFTRIVDYFLLVLVQ